MKIWVGIIFLIYVVSQYYQNVFSFSSDLIKGRETNWNSGQKRHSKKEYEILFLIKILLSSPVFSGLSILRICYMVVIRNKILSAILDNLETFLIYIESSGSVKILFSSFCEKDF